jgi:hypothetical protein
MITLHAGDDLGVFDLQVSLRQHYITGKLFDDY